MEINTLSTFEHLWALGVIHHHARVLDPWDHHTLGSLGSESVHCSVVHQSCILDSDSGKLKLNAGMNLDENISTICHYCLLHHKKFMIQSAGPSAHNHRLFREDCQENPSHFHQLLFIWSSLLWEWFCMAPKIAVGLVPQHAICACWWGWTVELWCGCCSCWSSAFPLEARPVQQTLLCYKFLPMSCPPDCIVLMAQK